LWSTTIKTVTEKVAVAVKAGTGPPGQKVRQDKGTAGQKLKYATTLAKVLILMGKLRDTDIRQLTGQLAPNSLDFSQVALSVSVCN